MGDCCENVDGDFRLLIGINAPEVLTGQAAPTGDEIAVPYEELAVTDCSENFYITPLQQADQAFTKQHVIVD